jgi:hypothetical protein
MIVLLVVASWSRVDAAPYVDEAVQDQWFTGSLEAPSPALTKAGSIAVEPYAIYQGNTGAYGNNWGHYSVAHDLNQLQSVTEIKYGITDQLTLATTPLFAHSWNDQTTSSIVGVGDLPVELEYRLNEMDRKTGSPSLTFALGMNFPTGAYDRLRTSLDGLGGGAYTAKEGLLLQSLFDTWGGHPLRLRFYGALFEPLASVSVNDVSVYGTSQGFHGQASPGLAQELGLGVEYGLNQQWVLAFDVVQYYANGTRLNGTNAAGNFVNTRAGSSVSFALAPAIEYNLTSNVGLIAGVEFSAAGRNTSSYIAPQIALTIAF